MSDKNNWLKEILDRIEMNQGVITNEISNIRQSVNDIIGDVRVFKEKYHGLYNEIEEHKISPCIKVSNGILAHKEKDHEGMVGKVIGIVVGIFALLGGAVAFVWYVSQHKP